MHACYTSVHPEYATHSVHQHWQNARTVADRVAAATWRGMASGGDELMACMAPRGAQRSLSDSCVITPVLPQPPCTLL